jgi:5'-3' exonuclease
MENKTALIIDVSNLSYRSSYANSSLYTSKGVFSGHIFGTVASLCAFLRNEFKETAVLCCFCYDGNGAKQERQKILSTYKANRTAHDFNPIPEVCEFLKSWPGLHIQQNGFEGDDAMVWCVEMRKGKPCVVLTGDRDSWFLLSKPNCRIFSPNLKRFVEPSDIYEAYHLDNKPEGIPLAKSFFGDSSDGIKGINRLLKKQIEPILNNSRVTTPDDFYAALPDSKPDYMSANTYTKLLEGKETVKTNYNVIIPRTNFDKSAVTKTTGDLSKIKARLTELECFSLLDQVEEAFKLS